MRKHYPMNCSQCRTSLADDDLFCGECGQRRPAPSPNLLGPTLVLTGLALGSWALWGLSHPQPATPTPTQSAVPTQPGPTSRPANSNALYSARGDVDGDGQPEQVEILRDERGTYLKISTHDGFPRFTSAPFDQSFQPEDDDQASEPINRAGLHLLEGAIKVVFTADLNRSRTIILYRYDPASETFRSAII